MLNFLSKINSFVWGTPTLLLIFFTGVFLSIRTGFFQLRYFKSAFNVFFKRSNGTSNARMTPLQSASTALSATMGIGNIVGVAGAIALGGPGTVFWMWVSSLFCMIIKFAEIALSIRFREKNIDGSYSGGAMYYIKNALPINFLPLAYIFCLCGVAAAFGVGNLTQINTMSASVIAFVKTFFSVSPQAEFFIKFMVGVICALCCALVLKNDGNIGRFCEKMFPVMTILYITITLVAIVINYSKIPLAFSQIFVGAFNPKSVTGGVVGSVFIGVRFGMSRGVFSNEAGLGTAPTAYACSDGDEISLGLMGVMEVFIDTVVVCTLTALTLLCVGNITYGIDASTTLTLDALKSVYGSNIIFVFCPVVCFFAFSSVVGWGLYGTKFICFLFGDNAKPIFLIIFILAQIPAAVFKSETVWIIAEIFNGIMILPNIISILLLNDNIVEIINYKTIKNRFTI